MKRSAKQKDRRKAVSVLIASLLTERKSFPQFEGAADEIPLPFRFRVPSFRRRRRAVECEGCIRMFLPDGKIFRRNCEPPECERVSARFGHSSGLWPGDFVDGQSRRVMWPRLDRHHVIGFVEIVVGHFPSPPATSTLRPRNLSPDSVVISRMSNVLSRLPSSAMT